MRKDNNYAMASGLIIVIIVILGIGAGGTYVAYDSGYIPWVESPRVPTTHSEAESGGCTDCSQLSQCQMYINMLNENIPSHSEVNFKFYYLEGATPSQVLADYKTDFLANGYNIYVYREQELYGNITIDSYNVYYGVFEKGITVSVCLAVAEGTGVCCFNAIGAIMDYEELAKEINDEITPSGI